MKLGVLLLNCHEGRQTSFTRDWAERAIGQVADYVFAQSAGRETIAYDVFDWVQLDYTEAQWLALGFNAYATVRPFVEATLGISLASYTHILIGIDTPMSSGGTTPGTITYLAARNFTPSLVAHELGHRYGAGDAFRESAAGLVRYQDAFCVMGALGVPYTFADDALVDPNAQGLNRSGPCMSAPTLMATGWLNEDEHGIGIDITGNSVFSSGGTMQDLRALAGAPGPGWGGPPLVIRYNDLLVEYRVPVPDGWDRGIPDPGPGAAGWVVVHRSVRGNSSAVYVNSIAASAGATLTLGNDNPLDIFNPEPLRLSVLSFNAAARTVRLHFSRRAARELPSGTIYGGVDVGGGGLVWTPGRGFVPVPPHSPLARVLEAVARVQDLQQILALASADEAPALSEETARSLRVLQESVADLPVEPSVSPLAHALQGVTEFYGEIERLGASGEGGDATQAFIASSRNRLTQIESILAREVEQERQR